MADNADYSLRIVTKDKETIGRILKIMNYEDAEYCIYRVLSAEIGADNIEYIDGYYCGTVFGDVAWDCYAWINDEEDKECKSELGAHYTSLAKLAKILDFGFEVFCQDEGVTPQRYWRVNHDGELDDEDTADNLDEGLEYYEKWSAPKLVYWGDMADD